MPILLYAHPFSSYCQKVLIALYENAIPFELRLLADDARIQAEHAALWPFRKMPVLVDGGRTPILSRAELERFGFKLAIFPVAGFLAMAAALRSVYGEILSAGSSKSWAGELYPFDDFSRLMGFERVWAFERDNVEQ